MFEISEWWLASSLPDRFDLDRMPARARKVLSSIEADADLRAVSIPGINNRGQRDHLLGQHLFAPGYGLLKPFLDDIPLGAFADKAGIRFKCIPPIPG
jgi:hypothetical protein